VMTRQPAAENRFTVAWPIPRLAPVSRSARRGWFECGVAMKMDPERLAMLERFAFGRNGKPFESCVLRRQSPLTGKCH
jgi:hypothetical protein